jgi:SAM-dependent methyltransferase
MMCPLWRGVMPPLFTTHDYRRPHDSTRYTAHWCGVCGYGKVAGAFGAAARAVACSEADVYDGRAEQLPPEIRGRRFDVVLLSHVLERCLDPAGALGNIREILAPGGGTLIVEVPNNEALGPHRFHGTWPWADVPRHLHLFTAHSLGRLPRAEGFTVVRTFHTGYTRQFKPEWSAVQSRIAWKLLLRTALAKPAIKYDSIRVHASSS